MYNVKYRQTDILYEPVLFEPLKQMSQLSYVQSDNSIYFGPYLD